ncbi:MAG: protein phosphatase 2C domain-containing protein [Capsulimonadaceae bacterium]
MNSDCAFFIGNEHKICQDYAVACTDKYGSYVIVADGCSSSPDTDIGARFLVKAAQTFLYQIEVSPHPQRSLELYHERTAHFASLSTKVLKLDPSCLDATMLTIKADGEGFVASCYGDGVVAMVRSDGKVELFSVEFAEGYPQYVSYILDASRRRMFDAQTTNFKEVTHSMIPDDHSEPQIEVSERVIEFHYGSRDDYYCAAVFSDGVHSFIEVDEYDPLVTVRHIPMEEVVSLLLAFRSVKDDFVFRRMQTFTQICIDRRWQHHDDLSVGCVFFGR